VPSTSDSLSRDVLPELVDEVVLETGPREVGPAERQVAAGLGIELADLLRQHLAHHGRVPVRARRGTRDIRPRTSVRFQPLS
jgi:hypothetical protein